MKKKIFITLFLLIIFIIIIWISIFNKNTEQFYLENKYYGSNNIEEIDINTFTDLINHKENFGVFVCQPMCMTSSDFEQVIKSFQNEYQISFKKINFSEIKDNKLTNFLEYYPSFIIYKDGKMIDFLDANAKEDLEYYKSVNGFKNWFTQYVKLK